MRRKTATYFHVAAACSGSSLQSTINNLLQVTFKPLAEVLEHSRSTGKHDILGHLNEYLRLHTQGYEALPCTTLA